MTDDIDIRKRLEEKRNFLQKIEEASWLHHRQYYRKYCSETWEEGPAKPGDKSGYGLNPNHCMHYGCNLARYQRLDCGVWTGFVRSDTGNESKEFRGSKDSNLAGQRAQKWCQQKIKKESKRLKKDIRELEKKFTVPKNLEFVRVEIDDLNSFYDVLQQANGEIQQRDGPKDGEYLMHVELPEDQTLEGCNEE